MAQSDSTAPSLLSEPSRCVDVEDLMVLALGRLAPERLDEVHGHLDVCATCQRVLSDAAHALATAVTADEALVREDVDWNTTFQQGALVGGRYEIRQFIARGGMGEVYEAFDRELRERVALKTVSSTACDNLRAVRRLKGEVQLARRVSHPNVCRIYDFGSHRLASTGAQLHFLTMEFVEGETLGQRLRLGGSLPESEARKLARELLLGLGAAHEAGVLHRDFKSDNVMLKLGPDGQGTAVVLDFGLARALDHQDGVSGSNSQVVGTPGFIAPEQLDGRPHSRASDVYAFGVVWFEMLTGELPFRPKTPPTSGWRALERTAPAPSRLNPAVPAEIDALVLRCLERTQSARYQSVADILDALDRLAPARGSSARWRNAAGVVLAASAVSALYLFGQPQPKATSTTATSSSAASPSAVTPASAPERRVVPEPSLSRGAAEVPSARVAAPAQPAVTPARAVPRTDSASAARLRPRASRREDAAPAPALEPREAPATPPPVEPAAPGPNPGPSAAPPPGLSAPLPDTAPVAPSPPRRKPDWENPFSAVGAALLGVKQRPI